MAAASPKDVILLLDTSGSMTGLRLEIGKKLIEFILDTLSDNDFFNVLTFSNKQVSLTSKKLIFQPKQIEKKRLRSLRNHQIRFYSLGLSVSPFNSI